MNYIFTHYSGNMDLVKFINTIEKKMLLSG